MGFFIVRIQLSEIDETASIQIYDKLHEEMQSLGFEKTIISGGIVYDLPNAEYYIELNLSRLEIAIRAEKAANRVGYGCKILVTEAAAKDHIFGYGLSKTSE